jgi:hypothetical protein
MNDNKLRELDELGRKIIVSMRAANRKLFESAAANNENLIVGDENGNPISVPAKELLKKMQK